MIGNEAKVQKKPEAFASTHRATTPVELAALDLVEVGVRPVQLLRSVVDRQAVGRLDVSLNQ